MTLNEGEQWLEPGKDEMTLFRLECAILEGARPDLEDLGKLPETLLNRSPLLQKAYGEHLAEEGRLAEAKRLLLQAVKAFARQTFLRELLAAFAALASVLMRLGEQQEAETALLFLKAEYDEGEAAANGDVLFALAQGARLLGEEANTYVYFKAAFEAFDRDGTARSVCKAALEAVLFMLLDDAAAPSSLLLRIETVLRLRSSADAGLTVYEKGFQAVKLLHEGRLEEACAAFGSMGRRDGLRLPRYLETAVRCCEQLALLRSGISASGDERERLDRDIGLLASDARLQLHYIRLQFERAVAQHDEYEAARSLQQADVYVSLCGLAGPNMLRIMEQAMASVFTVSEELAPAPDRPWSIYCFGPIRFSNGVDEVRDIAWKRKKAQELLLYLMLQPNYASPRDQVVEALFAETDTGKQANQLYVTVHRLRQVLHERLGCENAVVIKDGIVKMAGAYIEHADVEKYRSLIRVGDQLWANDRELAAELYGQAIQMYEELVPELSYVDWLDAARTHYAELQIGMLKKLIRFSAELGDYETAEAHCAEWLRLRPAEEEAYQHIIRLLMEQRKTAEANGWYRRLEKMCSEELNAKPLPETKQLLRGERC
ncbi:AfsR/SARP family transcriptional regulator [Paenibacillus ginsengarvi]|uniref:Bacterial transcriptional activator domain-containing protein n=1 Tax=Paenibacillus ginsengarvi TaxID=400777 RepID=A0A3B0BZ68_9BACL|nr:BTAD domain-containing putative transcriptional regulator [Paenibacillus ginsengarvi]RKN78913.1 hypothetical protein D7M11_22870 [Paenibacillus ginsengarvi]